MASRLTTFRYISPPKRGQGLRVGTTRRPPRGTRERDWQTEGYFEIWFPLLTPSAALLAWTELVTKADFRQFCERYERDITRRSEARRALDLLAAIAARPPISIGCFCADESFCHRTHLRKLIERRARELKLL